MKFLTFSRSGSWLMAVLALAISLLSGCSKSGPSSQISASAFDSVPADVKKSWDDGMSAWKAHRYLEAATNLMSVQAKAANLSAPQVEALNRTLDELGRDAFKAANDGDAAAVQAVAALKGGGGRRPGGAR